MCKKDLQRLAFQFAVKNDIKGFSARKGMAGPGWFCNFMDRHKDLNVRKSENLSLARAAE